MEITILKGDLFEAPPEYFLVHCISADLALGAGIALAFEKKFKLKKQLRSDSDPIEYPDAIKTGRVFNLVTKESYWHKPTYSSLRSSLVALRTLLAAVGVTKIAMPRIGCGLDGLSWGSVLRIIEEVFKETSVEIRVYEI